jgi:type IV secretory pathway VirB2 component (pilin)
MNLISYLKGKKTYIVAGIMVILTGLKALNYIDEQTYQTVLAVLGGLGLGFLRAGIKNSVRGTDEVPSAA